MRIHLSPDDLARIIVRPASPVAEAFSSLHRLTIRRRPDPLYRPWHARTAQVLRRQPACGLDVMSSSIVLWSDATCRVLTSASVDEALGAIWSTTPQTRRRDVELISEYVPVPGWSRAFIDGDRRLVERFDAAFRRFSAATVDPYWTRIIPIVEAERSRCARTLADGGVHALLSTLHPEIRWNPPILSWGPEGCSGYGPCNQLGHDIHLDGTGLVLSPSVFCLPPASLCRDASSPASAPTVFYNPPLDPITAGRIWANDRERQGGALEALLGPTRARVLTALTSPRSTSELARHLKISASSASEHAAVLRNCGLVVTERQGVSVRHQLTPLGARLIKECHRPDSDVQLFGSSRKPVTRHLAGVTLKP